MKHWTNYLPDSPKLVVSLAQACEAQRLHVLSLQDKIGKAQLELDNLELRFTQALASSGYTDEQKQDACDEALAISLLRRLEFSAAKIHRDADMDADRGLAFAHRKRWVEIQWALVCGNHELNITGLGRERLSAEHET